MPSTNVEQKPIATAVTLNARGMSRWRMRQNSNGGLRSDCFGAGLATGLPRRRHSSMSEDTGIARRVNQADMNLLDVNLLCVDSRRCRNQPSRAAVCPSESLFALSGRNRLSPTQRWPAEERIISEIGLEVGPRK